MKMIAFLTLQIEDLQQNWRTTTSATYQYLIVLGAVVVVSALVIAWALYFRKQHHHHHSHDHSHGHSHDWGKNPDAQEIENAAQQSQHHHKGRRRREHRPRNPTLAETGGLPPVRNRSSDDPIP
jgi:hypothetical protein